MTATELVALGNLPNLTQAERKRLLAPHLGTWFRIEGVVDDVLAEATFIIVSIRPDVPDASGLPALASFRTDLERAAALRKGSRIRVAGNFVGLSTLGGMALNDCEMLT